MSISLVGLPFHGTKQWMGRNSVELGFMKIDQLAPAIL